MIVQDSAVSGNGLSVFSFSLMTKAIFPLFFIRALDVYVALDVKHYPGLPLSTQVKKLGRLKEIISTLKWFLQKFCKCQGKSILHFKSSGEGFCNQFIIFFLIFLVLSKT